MRAQQPPTSSDVQRGERGLPALEVQVLDVVGDAVGPNRSAPHSVVSPRSRPDEEAAVDGPEQHENPDQSVAAIPFASVQHQELRSRGGARARVSLDAIPQCKRRSGRSAAQRVRNSTWTSGVATATVP